MTSDARAQQLASQATEATAAASDATRHMAELTLAQHDDVIAGIAGINRRLDAQDEELRHIKRELRETKEQTKLTNGNVTDLRLWRAKVEGKFEGLAQGAGGTGRLLFMLLSATSLVVGLVLAVAAAVR